MPTQRIIQAPPPTRVVSDSSATADPSSNTFINLSTAFAALPDDAGDVTFVVNSDFLTDEGVYEVPTDKGITSFTIATESPTGVQISQMNWRITLFANGIPLIVDKNIEIFGYVYGGGIHDIVDDSSITVRESAYVEYIHGGGRNATLTGDSEIVVEGETRLVAGGGHAKSSTQKPQAVADVTGSTSILVSKTGSSQNIYGGGHAESPSSGSTTTQAQANVGESTNITIAGKASESVGGGYATCGGSYASPVTNASVVAHVVGDTNLTYEASGRSVSNTGMGAYGGGYAESTSSNTNSAVANVGGSTHLAALEDDEANGTGYQKGYKAFSYFVGGGYAMRSNAQAAVGGDVFAKTARAAENSRQGTIGGGEALYGATANVLGTVHLEVAPAANQGSKYENAYRVVGGGWATCGSDDLDETQARVGSTDVIVRSGVKFSTTYDSSISANVVGGGFATSSHSNVSVVGTTSVTVESGVSVLEDIVGGGAVCTIGSGGDFSGSTGASADVGATRITLGDNVTVKNLIGGSKMITAPQSHAHVGLTETADSDAITVETGANFSTGSYYGGCFIKDTGGAKNDIGMRSHVTGSITSSIQGGKLSGTFFGGSYINNSMAYANISGNITNVLSDYSFASSPNSYSAKVVGGGTIMGNSSSDPDQIVVSGNVTTHLRNGTLNGTGNNANSSPWPGGRTGAKVAGSVELIFENMAFSNQPIYAQKSYSGTVDGDLTITLLGAIDTDLNLYPTWSGGNTTVVVGDGNTATTVTLPCIAATKDTPATDVEIHDHASLTLDAADPAPVLEHVRNVALSQDGSLSVQHSKALVTIAGNLTGGGTVVLPAGGSIAGAGALNGNLTLEVNGDLVAGQTYFDFSDQSAGSVAFTEPSGKFVLGTNTQTAGHKKWLMHEQFTVLFDSKGGSTVEAQEVVSDEKATKPDDPTRAGYIFAGWYASPDFSGDAWDFDANAVTADVTLYAKWVDGIKVTVTAGNNGSVDPSDTELVFTGTPIELRIMPDYGYKIDSVTTNGVAAQYDKVGLREGVLTLSPTEATTVTVTFAQLDKDSVDEIIDSLPTINPEDTPAVVEQKQDDVLDAKLDFESMTPEEKQAVSQDAVNKLNEAVVQVPKVEIEVKLAISTEVGANVAIPSKQESRFIGAVGKDEVEALKNGDADLLRVIVQIQNIDAPSEDDEREAFEGILGTNQVGQHFAASVTKELSNGTTMLTSEPITALPAPVQLVFDVPQALLGVGDGTTREFAMTRTHHNGTQWEAQLLDDEDGNKGNETILISTDRFSTYSIVYVDTHTVTFETNGGSAVDAQPVADSATVTEPTAPTREGFTFDGWFTDAACTNTYNFTTPVTKPFTLYAKWNPVAPPQPVEHTVLFEANGGSAVAPLTTVVDGSKITAPAAPKKDGFTFGGWHTDQGLTTPWNFESDTVTGDITLYAKWLNSPDPQPNLYEVVFVTGEGASKIETQLITKDNAASEPTAPARTGYEFGGWFTDDTYAQAWDFSTPVTAPLTLYAQWTEVVPPAPVKHYVAFETNGGSPSPAAQEIVNGGFATKPAVDPTRNGFVFAGWFADVALTQAYSFDTPVTQDLTLFAKWSEQQVPQPPVGDDPAGSTDDDPTAEGGADTPQSTKPSAVIDDATKRASLAPTGDNAATLTGAVAISLGFAIAAAMLAWNRLRNRQSGARLQRR